MDRTSELAQLIRLLPRRVPAAGADAHVQTQTHVPRAPPLSPTEGGSTKEDQITLVIPALDPPGRHPYRPGRRRPRSAASAPAGEPCNGITSGSCARGFGNQTSAAISAPSARRARRWKLALAAHAVSTTREYTSSSMNAAGKPPRRHQAVETVTRLLHT